VILEAAAPAVGGLRTLIVPDGWTPHATVASRPVLHWGQHAERPARTELQHEVGPPSRRLPVDLLVLVQDGERLGQHRRGTFGKRVSARSTP
jgi:hypothetical protein